MKGCKFVSMKIGDQYWNVGTRDVCIEGLFIRSKEIRILPDEVFKSFPNLIVYEASDCSIEEIWALNFNGLSKLRQLTLGRNKLQFIPRNAFQELRQLESLNLGENNFFQISCFQNLILSLFVFSNYLERNEISKLNPETFLNLKNIRIIDLERNECVRFSFDERFLAFAEFFRGIEQSCSYDEESFYKKVPTLDELSVTIKKLQRELDFQKLLNSKSEETIKAKNLIIEELKVEKLKLKSEKSELKKDVAEAVAELEFEFNF